MALLSLSTEDVGDDRGASGEELRQGDIIFYEFCVSFVSTMYHRFHISSDSSEGIH